MSTFLTVRHGDTLLPVVDVTNPAFALSPSQGELDAMAALFVRASAPGQEVSAEMRAALASSKLGSGLIAARGTFLTGLNTYLLKLGPDNLPADFHPIDRRIAASFPAVSARLRLQDMAALMTEGLASAVIRDASRPLHFVNIAGGPAADSWNTLIHLRAIDAALPHREVAVTVLDLDGDGPAFGARAFDALQLPEGPLNGLSVRLNQHRYNWAGAAELRRILTTLDLKQSLCAASSEGGLFEYGSDEEIEANLMAIADLTASDTIVVGSACRESEETRAHAGIGVTLRPRTRDAFQALVERSGWRIDRRIERPFNDSVRLTKSS